MALPGPPRVMIQNRSKAMIALIVVRIRISSSIGRSHGSVMLTKRRTAPAPSIRAARCRLSGIDCRPARIRSEASGAWFQTCASATMLNASRAVGQPVDRLVDHAEVEQDGIEGAVLAVQHPAPEHADRDRRHRPGHQHHAAQEIAPGEVLVEHERHREAEDQPAAHRDEGEVGGAAERGQEVGVGQDVEVVLQADEDPLLGQHVDPVQAQRQRIDERDAEDHEDHEQRRQGQQDRQAQRGRVAAPRGAAPSGQGQ